MTKRSCFHCAEKFEPRPQVRLQSYCDKEDCQRARRNLWQQAKRSTDQDYIDNQAEANRTWRERNPDYWRSYRASHPDYTARNRALQEDRNRRKRPERIAKKDVWTPSNSSEPRRYELREIDTAGIAKKDVWRVEIRILEHPSRPF